MNNSKQQIEKYIKNFKKGKTKNNRVGGMKRNNRSFLSMDNLDIEEEDEDDEESSSENDSEEEAKPLDTISNEAAIRGKTGSLTDRRQVENNKPEISDNLSGPITARSYARDLEEEISRKLNQPKIT